MAIPFKSLRYQPEPEQTWGINLRRVVRWKNEWSYLDASAARAHDLPRHPEDLVGWQRWSGFECPTGSTRNIELKPYVLGGVTTDQHACPAALERRDAPRRR